MAAVEAWLAERTVFAAGAVASLTASLGTGAGALPVLAVTRVTQRFQDLLLSVAAGIMLAATVFSLIQPGIEAAAERTGGPAMGVLLVGGAALLGAWAILLIHRHAPHEHFFIGRHDANPEAHRRLAKVWLFVIAITLHNFPEGMAVGVGFGGGNIANGLVLTTAIFLQNLPEGFVVALALLGQGYGRAVSVGVALATGLVETVGGLVGAGAVSLADAVLPWGLGFAAGAMLFVISHEIIPETHSNGNEALATFGLLIGFILMLLLDAVIG